MNQKIDEVGKKLDLDPKDISGTPSQKRKNRVFWGINAINVLLSGIWGLLFGFLEYRTQRSTYPYDSIRRGNISFLGSNVVTGILTLPNRRFNSKYNGLKRVGIFCGNVVLSFLVYLGFIELFKTFPNFLGFFEPVPNVEDNLSVAVLYGVYCDE
ncbi:MAG: hypothetical protein ACTSWW_01525 [Promethearchaeota archaeon]